ncbi:MAG: radical SAM protein, partial [Desulfurococcales archaeon]|nr:radical SAM protein [Desulfurococcales archaeon]
DDELAVNRKFIYEFVQELKDRGIDIPFSCGSRVDHVDRKYLDFLYSNGCNAIYFGVESGSQDTLDRIGKKITLDQAVNAFRWVREVGGFASGAFILGFPWETIDDMKKTVDFAIKLRPHYVQFTVLTPYPGTPMYEYALKHGLIEDWNWEHYTTIKPVMRGFHFTIKELGRMLVYAYRKFYLRWQFIRDEIRAGRFRDIAGIIFKEILSILKEKAFGGEKNEP